jgi:hypothetical protein
MRKFYASSSALDPKQASRAQNKAHDRIRSVKHSLDKGGRTFNPYCQHQKSLKNRNRLCTVPSEGMEVAIIRSVRIRPRIEVEMIAMSPESIEFCHI